jgi:hypothetical protein
MEFSHDGKMEKGKHILGKDEKRPAASAENVHRFNTQPVNEALNINKESVNSIMDKKPEEKADPRTENTNGHSFTKPVEKAEDAMDMITRSYAKLMKINADFNKELMALIKDSKVTGGAEMMDLIQKNLEASGKLAMNNTNEILGWYHKHTDLAQSFNTQFMDNMRIQTEAILKMQHKGLDVFTEWASDWWAPTDKEAKKM